MQHWAEGGEQFHCLSQVCWGANLPMQFCGFPLVPFGWDTGHQQGAEKASTYSSYTLFTPCLKGLRALQHLLVLWLLLVKDLDVTLWASLILTGYFSSDYSRATLNFSVHHCATVNTRAFISKSSHGRNSEGLRDFHLEISFLGTQQFFCLVRHTVQTALQKILVAEVLQVSLD